MLDSYHLIVINLVLLFLLSTGAFLYRFVYPKKNINLFVLLMLLSLLPLVSIFRKGSYESGDFTIHVYEAMSFFQSLAQGILFPRWGGELNATYGYPVFLFAYPLPNYLIALLHLLGFSFVVSLKLFLSFSYIGSGIAMYIFLRKLFTPIAGFVAAIFYLFAPYHLVDLHYRVAIGEVLGYVFLPIIFLSTTMLIKKKTYSWFLLLSVNIAFLILSHPAVSLSFVPIALLYGIFYWYQDKKQNMKTIYLFFFSLGIGLLLSAYYWLPVIIEKQFTLVGLFPGISFPKISELIYSSWRWGFLFQGPNGELSFVIGYIHIIVVAIALFFFIYKKRKTKELPLLALLLSLFFFLLFIMTPLSQFIWNMLPIARNFQFAYRLLVVMNFVVAFLSGIIALQFPKRKYVLYSLCILTIGVTLLNWGHRRVIPTIGDEQLQKNLPYSTVQGELNGQSIPKWVDPQKTSFAEVPPAHIEVLSGKAHIKELQRTTDYHEYVVVVDRTSLLKENTIYFPGWKVKVNNTYYPFVYNTKKYPGVITLSLPKGMFRIEVVYENTVARKIGFSLTIGGLISILFVAIRRKILL